MENKTCLFCGQTVQAEQNICPYCGSQKFDVPSAQLPLQEQIPMQKKKSRWWIFALIAGIAVLFAALAIVFFGEKECEHSYTEKIISEATYSAAGEKELVCSECGYTYTEEIPALPAVVELTVLAKSTAEEEKEPMVLPDGMTIPQMPLRSVLFDLEIKNVSDKDIKGVKGDLKITCGETILHLLCDFSDMPIESKGSATKNGYGFEIHSMSNIGELVVYDAEFEDLEFKFEVSEIIY